MSTHSPGPWHYDELFNAIYGEHTRPLVAAFLDSFPPTVQNGLLMAAAPDLLRLLRVLTSDGTHEEGEAAHNEAGALIRRLDGVE